MKAQLAILESLICIVILAGASYAVFAVYAYYTIPFPSRVSSAIFSIASVYTGNSTMAKCVDSHSYTQFCIKTLNAIINVYSIKGLSLSYEGNTSVFGNISSCNYGKEYCIISGNGSYMCQNLCGG